MSVMRGYNDPEKISALRREALQDARNAIATLDDDAFGMADNGDPEQGQWPVKLELLAKIDRAISGDIGD